MNHVKNCLAAILLSLFVTLFGIAAFGLLVQLSKFAAGLA